MHVCAWLTALRGLSLPNPCFFHFQNNFCSLLSISASHDHCSFEKKNHFIKNTYIHPLYSAGWMACQGYSVQVSVGGHLFLLSLLKHLLPQKDLCSYLVIFQCLVYTVYSFTRLSALSLTSRVHFEMDSCLLKKEFPQIY